MNEQYKKQRDKINADPSLDESGRIKAHRALNDGADSALSATPAYTRWMAECFLSHNNETRQS